jgi:hypothetical protein
MLPDGTPERMVLYGQNQGRGDATDYSSQKYRAIHFRSKSEDTKFNRNEG